MLEGLVLEQSTWKGTAGDPADRPVAAPDDPLEPLDPLAPLEPLEPFEPLDPFDPLEFAVVGVVVPWWWNRHNRPAHGQPTRHRERSRQPAHRLRRTWLVLKSRVLLETASDGRHVVRARHNLVRSVRTVAYGRFRRFRPGVLPNVGNDRPVVAGLSRPVRSARMAPMTVDRIVVVLG